METGSKVSFTVYGEPQGKARARTVRNQYTGKTMSYTPDKTALYENLIRMEYQAQTGGRYFGDVPMAIMVDCYFTPPKAKKRRAKPAKKPDADNILKAVCDALNGVAWKDDAQVVDAQILKSWAAEQPRIEVKIWEVET